MDPPPRTKNAEEGPDGPSSADRPVVVVAVAVDDRDERPTVNASRA
jgi:hypothetical protein